MIPRYVAPAGAPIGSRDVLRWLRTWTRLGEAGSELRSTICLELDRRHCSLVSTGRAGLTILLSALKSLASPDRDEVILPSYTCYSVAASTVCARLRPRIVDIDRRTLDFDLEKLGNTDFRRVLAIVPTSLYGLPAQLSRIARIARQHDVFLVDDAAQSLGATLDGRPSGGWGDAGILSFDKGKAISAIEGGAIVTDAAAIGTAIREQMSGLHRPGLTKATQHAAKLGAYLVCLRPGLYWIPNAIPGLGLGQTHYRTDFALQLESRWLAALASTMWPRLREFTTARIANAERYRSGIPDTASLSNVEPVEGARPSYLRFPVLVNEPSLRARLLRDLDRAGIGATGSYPRSIADVPEVQQHQACEADAKVGRAVAASIITLPTHPFVSSRDVDRAIDIAAAATRKA